jgi:poly(A) polymerase
VSGINIAFFKGILLIFFMVFPALAGKTEVWLRINAFIRGPKSLTLAVMDSPAKIDPILWKPPAGSREIFDALGEGLVRFVGGFVRNSYLGLRETDADMATVLHPGEVTRFLQQAGIKVVPTGIDHGTVTAVVNGRPFEITTLRRDVETDGRRAVVSFTTDWAEDAQRRDFTMNTLLADFEGNVFDPTGQGITDLKSGRVVFVGEPAQRIAEDYLRILRFFRFHALYGRGTPDAVALDACRAAAAKITTLSRERITQEMRKIVAIDDPVSILEVMRNCGVMIDFYHPGYKTESMKSLCQLQRKYDVVMVEPRLYLLAGGDEGHKTVFDQYMVFSNEQARLLTSLFVAVATPCGMKERLYRFGRVMALQSVLVMAAMEDVTPDAETMELLQQWDIPALPVSGDDLKDMGILPGPQMGDVLRAVEAWWIAADFMPGRDECRDQAKSFIRLQG